jgi:2-dehydro-3-deoxygluconokinase
VVTAFARNEVGLLLEDLILQGGVDTSLIRWVPSDGIGRSVRNGLNFTERGFGIRGAVGCSDRGHSAASQLRVGDIEWEHSFGTLGVRWCHTGGIFAALSTTTGDVVIEAARIAKKHRNRCLLRPQLSTVPLGSLRRPRSLPRGEPGHRSIS